MTHRPRVLVPDDYALRVPELECTRSHTDTLDIEVVGGPIECRALAAKLRDVDALVLIRERTYITPDLLDAARKLKVIAQLGKVRRNLSIDECTRRGIAVAEGPTLSQGTAELTWALLMSARRHIPQENAALRQGRWQTTLGEMLQGQTLGIWGYGRVGRILAGYARAFGMNVLVWGREQSQKTARADGHDIAASKEALFSTSDILSIHVRLAPETQGTVTEADLLRMKPSALFVNTARAELIAPGALVSALQAGRPAQAAIDVFGDEPVLDPAHPLLSSDRIIATPHMGYVNRQEYEVLFGDAFQNIAAFFAGRPINIANEEVLEKSA